MRWLALDVGAKRVGVAISDEAELVAIPKTTVPFVSVPHLVQTVKKLVDSWQVGALLVGIPKTRQGESRGERRVARLVAALAEALAIPVLTLDERGTTQEAASRLAERGLNSVQAMKVIDAVAACVLLESFLVQRKRGEKSPDS